MEGKGTSPPIDRMKVGGLGDQRLRLLLASGKGEMPAFGGLSTDQVDQLIAYLEAST